ncbi:allantoate permease, putative [Talaromyces stipitatus ATCC 10500]|uniref:Allantoate permease, putative n=1 Tax=Talaromyces stipitatus (strain ATCC 10500 / CBS 375.48 / QM 6759 / NRRL 1006) TaxID=441959 RepID=B8MJV5_TALSN|nr:allantoate permease, putative [Talaromyces stipitatus ATCC 10500]EED14772.1 allantoate permease, putative [Talaromyces stipitatus ATCC 10500]
MKKTHVEPSTTAEISNLKDMVASDMADGKKDIDLGQILEVQTSPQLERRVLLKIDYIMMPLMGFCYMLQYMDKLALSQATLFNVRKDLHLHGMEYSWTSAIFYFGYLVWSWPTSYLIVRLPLGRYLACSVFVWGGVLMCHAACKNFGGLMAARFFLGVGEAAIAPGFALLTGMFYKREEQPLRQAAWFIGNCIANSIGGLVAYGIGHIHSSSLVSWQFIFLILGAVTSGYAIILYLLLPDSPANAIFLKKHERAIAIQRTLENKTGILDVGKFKMNQVLFALKDPQAWLLVSYTFCVNLSNGGITTFSAIIAQGFGFSTFKVLLISMPSGAAQLIFLLLTSTIATFVRSTRIIMMIANCLVALIGFLLVYRLDPDARVAKMTGLCLGAVFAANIPLSLSLITSNVAGMTKKSTVSAMLFIAYCVGNIVGPQFYLASEEPTYDTGMRSAIAGICLGILSLVGLYVYYSWENRRRDRVYGSPETLTEHLQSELLNVTVTDQENESFRYVL